jgi:arylsulfatase A-like enzyme
MIPGPKAPEDAPNVLVVLIDDAGFGKWHLTPDNVPVATRTSPPRPVCLRMLM